MSTKLTKTDRYNQLLAIPAVAENADLKEFIEHEIEMTTKRNASKGQTKTQKENVKIEDVIAEALEGGKSTVTNLIKTDDRLAEFSNQKITAILRNMIADGRVVKEVEKKVSYFKLSSDDAE